jgi:plastocyanin
MLWQRSRLAVVGASLLSLAMIASCNGGNGSSNAPTAPTPSGGGTGGSSASLVITITGMSGSSSYSPNPATVRVGQTVAWRNADTTTHTATANAGTFDTGNIAPGATSTAITVTASGSFGYLCTLHPSMVGTLTVTP